jgi:hypothetical protein
MKEIVKLMNSFLLQVTYEIQMKEFTMFQMRILNDKTYLDKAVLCSKHFAERWHGRP